MDRRKFLKGSTALAAGSLIMDSSGVTNIHWTDNLKDAFGN